MFWQTDGLNISLCFFLAASSSDFISGRKPARNKIDSFRLKISDKQFFHTKPDAKTLAKENMQKRIAFQMTKEK